MEVLATVMALAVSLSMDSFAVSIASGIQSPKVALAVAFRVGLLFGVFHAGMPVIGWLIGNTIRDAVLGFSGIVAFVLLSAIGARMISGYLHKRKQITRRTRPLSARNLMFMAVATSIDALAVGVTLNLVAMPFVVSIMMIGATCFALSATGFLLGKQLGTAAAGKIGVLGGFGLIAIGVKLLFGA